MSVEPSTDTRRYVAVDETPTTVMSCLQTSIPMSTGSQASAPSRGPVLRVRSASADQTFVAGRDVVVGRDAQADVCVASPLVSRAHLVLRVGGDGGWTAVDNDSLNGMFVNGRRVFDVVITDGQVINIGEPDGPALTFTLDRSSSATQRFIAPSGPNRIPPERRPAPPGTTTVGRTPDNDIVVNDVLASRHHAVLVPTDNGTEIRDAGTLNGTFVNGVRVDSSLLRDGDMVTIGNIDLVFTAGTLVGRGQTDTTARTGGLQVQGATLMIEQGRVLLDNIAFSARPGTLTAVIGPSGAGKSTLAKLIGGATRPTQGRVSFEGHDIHGSYASLRSRIGMVPQDDVVHSRLTVDQALNYAAELRLPPDTSKEDRAQIVAQVLEELELTQHAHTRVDKLSGGQRKRASVAMELLTGPSLLILDEPTSGLDPALDRQVMTMLRSLADAGRVVLVVTHSLTFLDMCDQVVLLAPGGKMAFSGAPAEVGPAMGTTNWADIFSDVAAHPDDVHQRYLARVGGTPPPPDVEAPADLGKPVQTSFRRQFSTIARRQLRLILSDRGYLVFLALLPFILGALSLAVPGTVGFGIPDPMGSAPDEPSEILVLLNIGAVFMGIALTIRDLIGERPIFRREQAVGLSASAYLMAKVVVYCTAAVVQSAVMVGIVLYGKNAPTRGAVLLHNAAFELFVTVAATCVASVILGLALSALARSNEQIMPLLVVAIMAQLVLSGGLLPVAARLGLEQLSWITPARWGHAAAASTTDLRVLEPAPGPQDAHWAHMPAAWMFDMAMLAALSLVYGTFVRWKLRLKAA
jgi:ABC transport system ATP-binding/permease protein